MNPLRIFIEIARMWGVVLIYLLFASLTDVLEVDVFLSGWIAGMVALTFMNMTTRTTKRRSK